MNARRPRRRFIETATTLSIEVGRLVPARVVRMGSSSPALEQRDARGRWLEVSCIDDREARGYLTEIADLVEWVLAARA